MCKFKKNVKSLYKHLFNLEIKVLFTNLFVFYISMSIKVIFVFQADKLNFLHETELIWSER